MTEALIPHDPRIVTSELAPVEGRIGPEPEDFVVDEIPLFAPTGDGEHLYVQVKKRRWTTPDAIQRVARAAGVNPRDVGSAGMKDKHAVTTQWLSLPARVPSVDSWDLPEGIEVVAVTRHTHKLRTGLLAGNRFRIRLEVSGAGALERASAICARIAEQGLPNYFGGQRFGRGGQNLERAQKWAAGGERNSRSRFFDKLLPSVLQAEVFNRFLTLRLEAGLGRLTAGDVVRLGTSNSLFVVENAAAEQPRLERREIALTGPVLGPKMLQAKGAVLELELTAARELGLDREVLQGWRKVAPGTRRDLVVFPEGLAVTGDGPTALWLDFTLPAGSYATQLVRELIRGPHLDPER